MIYLDSSALVTFVVRRRNINDLEDYLAGRPAETCTSTIGLVETVRICDQLGTYPNLMARLVREHREITVTDSVRDAAAHIPGRLRSLDALHIASAEQFGPDLQALVTYDWRMADVARERGLPVEMPGVE